MNNNKLKAIRGSRRNSGSGSSGDGGDGNGNSDSNGNGGSDSKDANASALCTPIKAIFALTSALAE
jgi:hypothetical protein